MVMTASRSSSHRRPVSWRKASLKGPYSPRIVDVALEVRNDRVGVAVAERRLNTRSNTRRITWLWSSASASPAGRC